ncbi:hypothetical protein Dimus_020892, partial [Dionaea muscipula]
GEHGNSETKDKVAKKSSEFVEDFFDVVDGVNATDWDTDAIEGSTQPIVQKKSGKRSKARRVNPSSAESDYEPIRVQAQLDQAIKANARGQELLKQHQ